MHSKGALIALSIWLVILLAACEFDSGRFVQPGSTPDSKSEDASESGQEETAVPPTTAPEGPLDPAQETAVATPAPAAKPPAVVEYNLGEATITQEQFSEEDPSYEMPVRLDGLLGVPSGSGVHPLVLILHGDHPSCPPDPESGAESWPCAREQEQLNYRGFEYLVEELAAQGYVAVAINANAEYSAAYGEAEPGSRLSQIIDLHLGRLVGAGQGQQNPFGVEVYSRVDPKRVAWIAHSTAGELANKLIRDGRLDDAMTAAFTGYGPVHGLLQAAPTLALPDALPPAGVPLAVILAACDGTVLDLAGQSYFEAARSDPQHEAPVTTVLLQAANHNHFNEIVTPDMQAAISRPHCRLQELLTAQEQRAFLAAYAVGFLAALFGAPPQAASASAGLGLDPSAVVAQELYGRQALLTLSPRDGREDLLLRPSGESELSRNLMGGQVLAQDVQILYCPPGISRHKADAALEPCHRLQANHPGSPAQLLARWQQPGASLRFSLPDEGQDVRSHAALQLRAVLDPLSPFNEPGQAQSFTLSLTDTHGHTAAVTVPEGSPALAFPTGDLLLGEEGTAAAFSGHVQMSLLRVPLDSFAGVDLSAVSEVALSFDQTKTGALFLADLGFVRPQRYPGSYSTVLHNDGSLDRLRSIGRFQGTSSCTAVLIDTGAPQAPAVVLTSGHCAQPWSANAVLQDVPAADKQMVFNYFANTRAVQIAVPARRILYSTMKGRDIALVELQATLGELQDQDITPFLLAAAAPGESAEITVIGAPSAELPSDMAYLRQEACATNGSVSLLEHDWQFSDALRFDCQDVYGGSSGSPILATGEEEILAIANTTTIGGRSPCELDAPCEISSTGTYFSQDTSYATPVYGIASCFAADGRFDISLAGCPLDGGRQLQISGSPLDAVRPTTFLADGSEQRQTWNATLSGDLPYYRYKIGPVAATDCRVHQDYGAVQSLAARPVIDDALPDAEGHYTLCVLAGPGPDVDQTWQQPRFASSVRVQIDTTPPTTAPTLSITGSGEELVVEPHYDPPQLATILYKRGLLAATDCAAEDGYSDFAGRPLTIPATELPALLCVLGLDSAGNASQPVRYIVDAPS